VKQTLTQMLRIGVESFPVAAMTSLFTGMVLALQTGSSFKNLFNEPLFIGMVMTYEACVQLSRVTGDYSQVGTQYIRLVVSDFGPTLTGMMLATRVGAGIAAEIGSMKVTEQIDALYTLGTDPVRYLVIPRVLAFLFVLPLLTVFSDYAGILGGAAVAYLKLGVPTQTYWDDVFNHLENKQFFHGLSKTWVFALCIAFICCYKGLTTRGGAEGVGKATTSAVVASMTAVLVVDYFLTAILVALGIS
jgi:phospholipid/cholesterol/gamma-HCH transport system permease protein